MDAIQQAIESITALATSQSQLQIAYRSTWPALSARPWRVAAPIRIA